MNVQYLNPDCGEFETIAECPYCGFAVISYQQKGPHIEAKCAYCGRHIKYCKKFDDDEWRKRIKERALYRCERCGKQLVGREAVAHHLLPKWFMPERRYQLENGICLCIDCHKQIHGKGGTIKEEI